MPSGLNFSKTKTKVQRKNLKRTSWGFYAIFLVLLLVVAGYGAQKLYIAQLESTLEEVQANIEREQLRMDPALVQRVVDFSERLGLVSKNFTAQQNRITTPEVLTEIERVMVPSVVLLEYDHSVGRDGVEALNLRADADNFDVMAKQILRLRESPFFTNVQAGSTSRDEAGRIVFTASAEVVARSAVPEQALQVPVPTPEPTPTPTPAPTPAPAPQGGEQNVTVTNDQQGQNVNVSTQDGQSVDVTNSPPTQ